MKDLKQKTNPQTPISDEAMSRLVQIMNDSPTTLKLAGTEWEIRSLKPGTQWLIAEESCKIVSKENMTMGDVIKQFAVNLPSVARVIALALLNDKEKIEGEEYKKVYGELMWGDFKVRDWSVILMEVLNLIDVDFFFASTNVIKTLRQTTLERRTTMEEQR